MQDIMAAAGVTSGGLHHHYSTKKQLGLAVINERVAATVEEAWIDPVRNAPTAEIGVRKAITDIIADLKKGRSRAVRSTTSRSNLPMQIPNLAQPCSASSTAGPRFLPGRLKPLELQCRVREPQPRKWRCS